MRAPALNIPAGQTNVVHRVHESGGLLPKLFGRTLHRSLTRGVHDLNEQEYRVVLILPDTWSWIDNLFSIALLLCTLFLYTYRPGLIVIAEHTSVTQSLIADEVRRLYRLEARS